MLHAQLVVTKRRVTSGNTSMMYYIRDVNKHTGHGVPVETLSISQTAQAR